MAEDFNKIEQGIFYKKPINMCLDISHMLTVLNGFYDAQLHDFFENIGCYEGYPPFVVDKKYHKQINSVTQGNTKYGAFIDTCPRIGLVHLSDAATYLDDGGKIGNDKDKWRQILSTLNKRNPNCRLPCIIELRGGHLDINNVNVDSIGLNAYNFLKPIMEEITL